MKYIERSQTINGGTPVLEVFTVVDGFVQDCETVEFQIFDATGAQTYPVAGRETLDVSAYPTGGRLGIGRYAATWAVPADEPLGKHTIVFYWKLLAADTTEYQTTIRFEVLGVGTIEDFIAPYYASISKMREEGITEEDSSDARLLDKIALASSMIEGWTKRHFEPRWKNIYRSGTLAKALLLDQPICYIAELATGASPHDTDESIIDVEAYRVFNRHLSQHLLSPDDRNNPKISFVDGRGDLYTSSSLVATSDVYGYNHLQFPKGVQNVRIAGVFGYTDPNGTLYGRTPRDIEHACMLLTMRELYLLTDTDKREDAQRRWRLLGETTRDQSYKLAPLAGRSGAHSSAVGFLSGDPTIDNILIRYMRPPAMGAA